MRGLGKADTTTSASAVAPYLLHNLDQKVSAPSDSDSALSSANSAR